MARRPWHRLLFCFIAITFAEGLVYAETNPYRNYSPQQQTPPAQLIHNNSHPRKIPTNIQNNHRPQGNVQIDFSDTARRKTSAPQNQSHLVLPQSKSSISDKSAPANSHARLNQQNQQKVSNTKTSNYDSRYTISNNHRTAKKVMPANHLVEQRNLAKTEPTNKPSKVRTLELESQAIEPLKPQGPKKPPSAFPKAWSSLTGVLSSLAVVIGLFFVVAWIAKRGGRGMFGKLPQEVFEVLGHTPSAPKQQLQLLRLGNKLILVCVTPTGMESLAEVTDAEEVDRLSGLCLQSKANSSSTSFKQILKQFGSEATKPGFLDNEPASDDSSRRSTHV